MAVSISAAGSAVNTDSSMVNRGNGAQKPVWNPGKVYQYVEDMSAGFTRYKKEATAYYSAQIGKEEGDGTLTVDELKEQIKELFPDYTLTGTEPKDVVPGKYYLYIDDSNLNKMASSPAYRAKVYGLMDSELQGKKGFTLKYSDGKNVTAHLTGTIFSVADKNGIYEGGDGIPYLGSCTSDQPYGSTASHVQVRSQSFLHDSMNPVKAAVKERGETAAGSLEAKQKERRAEEKKEERENLKMLAEEQIEERREQQQKLQQAIIDKKIKGNVVSGYTKILSYQGAYEPSMLTGNFLDEGQ